MTSLGSRGPRGVLRRARSSPLLLRPKGHGSASTRPASWAVTTPSTRNARFEAAWHVLGFQSDHQARALVFEDADWAFPRTPMRSARTAGKSGRCPAPASTLPAKVMKKSMDVGSRWPRCRLARFRASPRSRHSLGPRIKGGRSKDRTLTVILEKKSGSSSRRLPAAKPQHHV